MPLLPRRPSAALIRAAGGGASISRAPFPTPCPAKFHLIVSNGSLIKSRQRRNAIAASSCHTEAARRVIEALPQFRAEASVVDRPGEKQVFLEPHRLETIPAAAHISERNHPATSARFARSRIASTEKIGAGGLGRPALEEKFASLTLLGSRASPSPRSSAYPSPNIRSATSRFLTWGAVAYRKVCHRKMGTTARHPRQGGDGHRR